MSIFSYDSVTHFSEHRPYGVLRRELFGVSCPIADLIVEVQTVARSPFVSLFQVFTAEEGEHWNRSEGVLEAHSIETHEGVRVNRWEHLAPTVEPDLKHLSHRRKLKI